MDEQREPSATPPLIHDGEQQLIWADPLGRDSAREGAKWLARKGSL